MAKKLYTTIIGSGSYIPTVEVENDHFLNYDFYDRAKQIKFDKSNKEIIAKFKEITNIEHRRWVTEDLVTSDIATIAVKEACNDAEIGVEDLDFILIGHNFVFQHHQCLLHLRQCHPGLVTG